MGDFPFGYERIDETTWAYLSSLLMLALFFKFNRFWSVRNFDLFLIILLAPGILFIQGGRQWLNLQAESEIAVVSGVDGSAGELPEVTSESSSLEDAVATNETSLAEEPDLSQAGYRLQRWGYYWLFGVGLVFLIRLFLDPMLIRRPLLEPNLTIGGLVFLGCSLMMFLFANVVTSQPGDDDLQGARDAVKILQREAVEDSDSDQLRRFGPGYALFNLFPIIPSFGDGQEILNTNTNANTTQNMNRYVVAAKSLAIASQVFLVTGLVLCGFFHFNSFQTGVGMAVIYLMLPYTAVYTGHVLHILPAALLIWAFVFFRRPIVSGMFIGLAIGVAYYPLFLLPLWMSFYWKKGIRRFTGGVAISVAVCIGGLVFTSVDLGAFGSQLQKMFGFWVPLTDNLEGIWALGWDQQFRLPIMVAFVSLCVSFTIWPIQKNLGTLISYSCAIMVAVQFWHGFGGGLYMAWYVPLALMVFFRPNMDGRVASFELARAAENRILKASRSEIAAEI